MALDAIALFGFILLWWALLGLLVRAPLAKKDLLLPSPKGEVWLVEIQEVTHVSMEQDYEEGSPIRLSFQCLLMGAVEMGEQMPLVRGRLVKASLEEGGIGRNEIMIGIREEMR